MKRFIPLLIITTTLFLLGLYLLYLGNIYIGFEFKYLRTTQPSGGIVWSY